MVLSDRQTGSHTPYAYSYTHNFSDYSHTDTVGHADAFGNSDAINYAYTFHHAHTDRVCSSYANPDNYSDDDADPVKEASECRF